jgi:hypothetical protein
MDETEFTAARLRERIVEENPHEHGTVIAIINAWLAKGYGVAVYAHEKHQKLTLLVSYGMTPGAILAGAEPPARMFDSGYVLAGTYDGMPLEES